MNILLSPSAEKFARGLLEAWETEAIYQSVIISVRQDGHGLKASSDNLPAKVQPTMGTMRELAAAGLVYLSEWDRYIEEGVVNNPAHTPLVVRYEMTLLPTLMAIFKKKTFTAVW